MSRRISMLVSSTECIKTELQHEILDIGQFTAKIKSIAKIHLFHSFAGVFTHFWWRQKYHRYAPPIQSTTNWCPCLRWVTFLPPCDCGRCHQWPYYMMPSTVMPKRCGQRLGLDKLFPSAFWSRSQQPKWIGDFVPPSLLTFFPTTIKNNFRWRFELF